MTFRQLKIVVVDQLTTIAVGWDWPLSAVKGAIMFRENRTFQNPKRCYFCTEKGNRLLDDSLAIDAPEVIYLSEPAGTAA